MLPPLGRRSGTFWHSCRSLLVLLSLLVGRCSETKLKNTPCNTINHPNHTPLKVSGPTHPRACPAVALVSPAPSPALVPVQSPHSVHGFLALALALRPSRSLREDIDHLSSSASMDMDMNITGAMACVSCVACVMRRLFELGPAEAES